MHVQSQIRRQVVTTLRIYACKGRRVGAALVHDPFLTFSDNIGTNIGLGTSSIILHEMMISTDSLSKKILNYFLNFGNI